MVLRASRHSGANGWGPERRVVLHQARGPPVLDRLLTPSPFPSCAAIMEVYEDFFMYRHGVYRHTPVAAGQHRRHGTHSVKITGWGEERTADGSREKYWIAANSWGRDWGEHGYFRIARGVNECDIEAFVVGVWGRVGMEDMHHRK
ncbi:Tubulointerstitial nephritis antigen-like [Varanus komodoensis]|nr:Tubulointerstitial nephritis antigen-like [Varanus komodoensis]